MCPERTTISSSSSSSPCPFVALHSLFKQDFASFPQINCQSMCTSALESCVRNGLISGPSESIFLRDSRQLVGRRRCNNIAAEEESQKCTHITRNSFSCSSSSSSLNAANIRHRNAPISTLTSFCGPRKVF